MNQLRDDLIRVREVLDEHGWCDRGPGHYKTHGRVCVEEACAEATIGFPQAWAIRDVAQRVVDIPPRDDSPDRDWKPHTLTDEERAAIPRYLSVLDALQTEVSKRDMYMRRTELWSWNDSSGTSLNDVKAVIAAAIAAAPE